MRLFQKYQSIYPKLYDESINPTWEEKEYHFPHNNCKLFCGEDGKTILWTEDGYYDVKTGKKIQLKNQVYHPLELLEDNEKAYPERDLLPEMETHPAYGSIKLIHTNGSRTLFGAPYANCHYCTITIERTSCDKETAGEHLFGDRRPIVEIALTPEQLGLFLCLPNMGEGIPCTILYNEMDGVIPPPPIVNNLDKIDKEFHEKVKDLKGELPNYLCKLKKEIKEKKTFSKSWATEVLGRLEAISRETGNLACCVSDYKEATEKMKYQAFGEMVERGNDVIQTSIRNILNDPEVQEKFLAELKNNKQLTDNIT